MVLPSSRINNYNVRAQEEKPLYPRASFGLNLKGADEKKKEY
jgi:hypothetical protein